MKCPKCNSESVSVQAVTTTKEKTRHGIIWWILVGWWWEMLLWLFFTLPRLFIAILGGRRKKIVSETHSEAICQECGYHWKV